jgi:hypothetical protein
MLDAKSSGDARTTVTHTSYPTPPPAHQRRLHRPSHTPPARTFQRETTATGTSERRRRAGDGRRANAGIHDPSDSPLTSAEHCRRGVRRSNMKDRHKCRDAEMKRCEVSTLVDFIAMTRIKNTDQSIWSSVLTLGCRHAYEQWRECSFYG